MVSEQLLHLASWCRSYRERGVKDVDQAFRTIEAIARDLVEDVRHLERQVVPIGARRQVVPDGVVDLEALRRLRSGGAL
ncbi:hypothetical protein [Elioraea sp.]|uniref:hypothetical protein n=1 Tax=Elioraea sp. TaxID=2185103 RepID=UPI0025BEB364|nr:hypothetical protein [Elioraea sp.]